MVKYFLVRFTDGIYHIVNNNQIKNRKGFKVSAQWENKYYLAEILEEDPQVDRLENLKKDYEEGKTTNVITYYLVRFTDGIYHILSEKDVKNRKGCQVSAQWGKKYYLAIILAEDFRREHLENLKTQYEADKGNETSKLYENLSSQPEGDKVNVKNIQLISTCSSSVEKHLSNECDLGILQREDNSQEDLIVNKENIPDEESPVVLTALDSYTIKKNEQDLVSPSTSTDLKYSLIDNDKGTLEKDDDWTDESVIQNNFPSANGIISENINILSNHQLVPPKINSSGYKDCQRYPNKKQYCIFCETLVNRFARHLIRSHHEKDEVKEIVNLPSRSFLRKKKIDKLRCRGNYQFNHSVHRDNHIQIVARRSHRKNEPKEYTDCPTCFMRLSKISLWKHSKKCNENYNPNATSRDTYAKSKSVTLPLHSSACTVLRTEIFPYFRNDEFVEIIRNDYLAILYGNKLVAKYRARHHYKMIKSNLRYIGRFLTEMRKLSESISDLSSCLEPAQYDNVVTSIKTVAKFVEEINNGTTPSMDKCRLAIKNSQELNKRTPVQLKTWVQNYIKMKSRPQSNILDKNIDEFRKHRLTDVMEEENEDGHFSRSNRKRISSIGSAASSIDHLWDVHPRRLSEAGLSRHTDSSAILTEDTDSFIIGQKVWVSGTKPGHIAFIGETQFAPGEWAGIALEEPIGKNDGSVGGIRYFQCEPKKGVFARLTRLTRFPLTQESMVSGDTHISFPLDSGVRRSPVSPTGSTRGALKSPTSRSGSNMSLASAASHVIDYKTGDRVIIKSSQGSKVGTVRYIGTTEFANGEWVGVELDEPRGKNDGSVNGKRYFECRPNFGLFAPATKVSKSPSKIKPNSCQVHSSSSGLPPSGILKRTNSKESMLSNLSMTSASSNVRRVRLGVTSLTPKKVSPKATSTPVPTRTALQDVLKEKQLHIEQLLKERDLERAEITKAANQAEEAEQKLAALRQEYVQYRTECENQIQHHMNLLNKLKEDRSELVAYLDEEKRKTEDLTFRLAESSIFKEDAEVANENNVKKIKELEEALQKERDKVENFESDANKLFEAEENLIKAKEEIDSLRKQLQETRDKQIVLEGDNASTSVLITTLQKEVDEYKNDVEERDEMVSVLKYEIAKITSDFKKQLQDTENQKTELEALCSTKTDEINSLKIELEQINNLLQNKLFELEKMTTEKLSSDTMFEKDIDKLKMELNSKIFDLENISKTNSDKDVEIEKLQKELDLLETQVQMKDSEIAKLQRESIQKTSELDKSLQNTKQHNLELQEYLKSVISEFDNAKLKFQDTECDLNEKFNKVIEEKVVKINQLEVLVEESTKQNNEIFNKLQELQKQFETKCSEIEFLKISNVDLNKASDELHVKLIELQKDSDTLKEKELLILSLRTELQTTKVDLESVTSNLSQYQTNMGDVESALKKERDEIKESLKAKIFELQEAKKIFSSDISEKDMKIEEQSTTILEKTAEVQRLQTEIDSLTEKNVNTTDELEVNRFELENVKRNNVDLTRAFDDLNVKIIELQKDSNGVKEKEALIMSLQTELQATKVELESVTSKLLQYQSNMGDVEFALKKELDEIKESLKTKIAEFQETQNMFSRIISEKDETLKEQSSALADKTAEVERLERAITETNMKNIDELKSKCIELECFKINNSDLIKGSHELNRKIIELQKDSNTLKERELLIQDLQAELQTAKGELETVTNNLTVCQSNMGDVESTLMKERDEIKESLTTKIVELEQAEKMFSKIILKNDNTLKEQSTALLEKTSTIERLQKELKTITKTNAKFVDELIEKHSTEIKNRDEQLTNVMNELNLTKKEINDHESELRMLKENFARSVSSYQNKVDIFQKNVHELEETRKNLELNIEKQKTEYEDVIKTISESESMLRNQIESNNDAQKVKDLEAKLSEFIVKLGQKDKMLASKNEEIFKINEQLNVAKSHHNGLDHKVFVEPSGGQINESPQYQQLLDEKMFAENQVTFLNSIIADMQKKSEEQQARIEILEMGYNAAAADELTSLGFNREAKIPAPRMYCDICEEFDQHETEDCPTQCDDAPVINRDSKEKPPPRPYCDICEAFGHATEDCTNMDQEF